MTNDDIELARFVIDRFTAGMLAEGDAAMDKLQDVRRMLDDPAAYGSKHTTILREAIRLIAFEARAKMGSAISLDDLITMQQKEETDGQ